MNETQPPSLPAMIAGELAAHLPTDTAISFTCDKIVPVITQWLEQEGRDSKSGLELFILAARVERESLEMSSILDP